MSGVRAVPHTGRMVTTRSADRTPAEAAAAQGGGVDSQRTPSRPATRRRTVSPGLAAGSGAGAAAGAAAGGGGLGSGAGGECAAPRRLDPIEGGCLQYCSGSVLLVLHACMHAFIAQRHTPACTRTCRGCHGCAAAQQRRWGPSAAATSHTGAQAHAVAAGVEGG